MTGARTAHTVAPAPATTVDVFSRDVPPILTVDPGDTVIAGSLDAHGYLARLRGPGGDEPRMFSNARGHCLTGPIASPVPGIHAVTPAGRITFGFSKDLDEATGDALDAMLTWMQSLYGLDKAAALALASPLVDLRITQVANDVWGVHAVLPGTGPARLAGSGVLDS